MVGEWYFRRIRKNEIFGKIVAFSGTFSSLLHVTKCHRFHGWQCYKMRQNSPFAFSEKLEKLPKFRGFSGNTENSHVTWYLSRKVGWVWHAVRAAVCHFKAAKIVAFPFLCWAGKTPHTSVGQAYSVEWCKAARRQRTESEQREFTVKCKLDWNQFELGSKMSVTT